MLLKNHRHERFAQLIARGTRPKDAYTASGYNASYDKVAINGASRLLEQTHVRERVAELQGDQAKVSKALTRQFVLEGLMLNLSMAMGKSPVMIMRPNKKTGTWHSFEAFIYDGKTAVKTLELLGKEAGMFSDIQDNRQANDFAGMSDDELRKYVSDKRLLISDRQSDNSSQPVEIVGEIIEPPVPDEEEGAPGEPEETKPASS